MVYLSDREEEEKKKEKEEWFIFLKPGMHYVDTVSMIQ